MGSAEIPTPIALAIVSQPAWGLREFERTSRPILPLCEGKAYVKANVE
jgi:hypothetical protein